MCVFKSTTTYTARVLSPHRDKPLHILQRVRRREREAVIRGSLSSNTYVNEVVFNLYDTRKSCSWEKYGEFEIRQSL